MDYAEFIRNRITQLRISADVSEYQLSLDLGHSKGYIQGITSGRALPSMNEFLAICDYFGVTPKEFFDDSIDNPALIQKLVSAAGKLSAADLDLILTLIEKIGH